MDDDELITVERRLWTDGVDAYERHLADDALLVFPAPVGVLSRAATLESLRGAPRWRDVTMDDVRSSDIGDRAVALVYSATATREGEPPYRALVSSVYVIGDDGPRLVLHQQSPHGGLG